MGEPWVPPCGATCRTSTPTSTSPSRCSKRSLRDAFLNEPSRVVRELAERIASVYLTHAKPLAVLLAGSAGAGGGDAYSDVDLIFYYEELPALEAVAAARAELDVSDAREVRSDEEDSFGERYEVDGIEVQTGHILVSELRHDIARLLDELDVDDQTLPKIVGGLVEGVALHGEGAIARWREEAAYSDELQRAVVEKYWRIFPLWYFEERIGARDAVLWQYQILVEAAFNLLGVLAALNRIYFSTFELKRMRRLVARLEIAPPNLAERIEALFSSDAHAAIAELESLVVDTAALLRKHMPDVDVEAAWRHAGQPKPPGSREQPWA
jgi:hypothetical protein